MYKVDLEKSTKDDYRASFTKIEERTIKDPITEYILAKPRDKQISDISYQLLKWIGNIYPIPDQEIQKYISRVIENLNSEELRDILVRKYSYAGKIKSHIKFLSSAYAEKMFFEQVKSRKINVKPNWKFPKAIVPGNIGASIGNSLYEREGKMNSFEEKVIMDIGTSKNIAFWHRNLGRGKGFCINGFKSNHYPDFILYTKSGRIILLETKGGHLDGSDSASKCKLGNTWEQLAGSNFAYFMVFETKEINGAHSLDRAKELIGSM